MSFEVHQINTDFVAGTVAVGTTLIFAGKAPTDATGGGITVLNAYAFTSATNAAGSAPQFRLLKYSAAGAVSGTIAAAYPGTGALTTAAIGTMTVSNGWVDGGEFIVVERGGTAASATSAYQNVIITYVMGR